MKECFKVLHVAPMTVQPTGVSVYVSELIRALALQPGISVGLLPSHPYHPSREDCISEVTYIPAPERLHYNPFAIDKAWIDRIESVFGRPDLIHIHDLYEPFETALARLIRRSGWHYIVSPHGGFQPYSQARKAWKKIAGNLFFSDRFIQEADAVHVLNDAECIAVAQRFPEKLLIQIPNGVSDDLLSGSIAARPTNSGDIVFGFLGRMDMSHKGLDVFLQAVYRLQKRDAGSLRAQFVFAGPFPSNKDETAFQGLVACLPDPDAIKYQGVVTPEKRRQFLDSLDVFFHTSRHEGMPGAVLEAMARGRPCLVTPGTNMQMIIKESGGGWNCDFRADGISDALRRILESPSEITVRGGKARSFAAGCFVWSGIAQDYVKRIETLLAGRK